MASSEGGGGRAEGKSPFGEVASKLSDPVVLVCLGAFPKKIAKGMVAGISIGNLIDLDQP